MPTFPPLHPPNPTVGTGGYAAPGANTTPVPLGGPRTVSFTQQRPGTGNLTLDALIARQKAAAAGQQQALGTPQATIAGGLGQMLTSYMEGLKGYKAEQEEAPGAKKSLRRSLAFPRPASSRRRACPPSCGATPTSAWRFTRRRWSNGGRRRMWKTSCR